jgi:hypothetical protein
MALNKLNPWPIGTTLTLVLCIAIVCCAFVAVALGRGGSLKIVSPIVGVEIDTPAFKEVLRE